MNVNNMTKEQVLEWTTKEGAYEFGRQKGYNYGFLQGHKAGQRGAKELMKELSIIIKAAQEVLRDNLLPGSLLSYDNCINELLEILKNEDLVELQQRVEKEINL